MIDMTEVCTCGHARLLHVGKEREWACAGSTCRCQKFNPKEAT